LAFSSAGILGSTGITQLRRYYDPVRLPWIQPIWLFIPKLVFGQHPGIHGSLRFLNLPLYTRHPLAPRRIGLLHMPMPS